MVSDFRVTESSTKVISIVIPTLNEVEGIRRVIKEIPVKELEGLGYECEILVVDGGSDDGTVEVARGLGARVITVPGRGYGRAYKVGFSRVTGGARVIVTLDGDGQYPPECIPRLIRMLTEGNYDFITTNRFAHPHSGSMNLLHKVGNKVLTFLTRVLFNIDVKDSQSGMWAFRKDALKYIMPDSNGMGFSEEIKIRAFLNVKSVETPVHYRRRMGKPKLRTFMDGISNLLYLFILWFKLRWAGRGAHKC